MDIYRAQFGARLQAALAAAGVSQTELAEKLDVKDSTISRWVNGHDFPKKGRLAQISKLLKVTVDSLLGTGARPAPGPLKPSPRDLKALIEGSERTIPYSLLAPVLAELLRVEPEIRAAVLAVLYDDDSIAQPYLDKIEKPSAPSRAR